MITRTDKIVVCLIVACMFAAWLLAGALALHAAEPPSTVHEQQVRVDR